MPSRTLSPRISTTVTVMSLLMTILSFFFLDSTSIGAYPFPSPEAVPVVGFLHKPVHQRTCQRAGQPRAGPVGRCRTTTGGVRPSRGVVIPVELLPGRDAPR